MSFTRIVKVGAGCIKVFPAAKFKGAGSLTVIKTTNFQAMSTTTNNFTVEHDSQHRQFYIPLNNPESSKSKSAVRAILDYDTYTLGEGQEASNVMDMYHTEVPPELQGKGIAQLLAKAAMDHAVANNYKMKLTCTYLQNYIKKNPVEEYISRLI
ncbi:hypothetical protein CHUAL_000788 [Chamberlinius hualienensis]